jgi:predicted nucleic acid-binding protein
MFLIDTNVISEIRKGDRANPAVSAWFDAHAAESYFLSVLTLGEIRKGIEQIRGKDAGKATAFEIWLSEIAVSYEGRILGIGLDEAEIWGRLSSGGKLPEVDGLIAATALAHGLTVATRNVRDFERCGVNVINPWENSG